MDWVGCENGSGSDGDFWSAKGVGAIPLVRCGDEGVVLVSARGCTERRWSGMEEWV